MWLGLCLCLCLRLLLLALEDLLEVKDLAVVGGSGPRALRAFLRGLGRAYLRLGEQLGLGPYLGLGDELLCDGPLRLLLRLRLRLR